MKKLLLGCVFALTTVMASAQIITYVESPASLEANLSYTWADPPGGWGTPDLLDPNNSITDTLALAFDDGMNTTSTGAITADSAICGPVVTDLTGKIALFWRGGCEFGTKALNAQNAGAIGAIIINNAGAPVGMAPGADGANVTIPYVMISTSDGQNLVNALKTGAKIVVFIGNKSGLFPNDLGMFKQDIMMPPYTGKPAQIATDASEYSSQVGAWVRNFGFNQATGVTLNCEILSGATSVYNETSTTPINIPSGDSAFIALPDFSLASYSGYYDMNYTVTGDSTDFFPGDDGFSTNFMIDEFLSNGIIDQAAGLPEQSQFFRLANQTGGLGTCLHFRDANASRMKVTGIWGAATTAADDSLTGQIIKSEIWQWDDSFTDINDAGLDFASIFLLEEGEYIYTTDQQNQAVYIPLNNEVGLEDNQRYVFCIATFDDRMFLGHEGRIDYDENRNNANVVSPQPINLIFDQGAGTWNAVGFGTDVVPSLAVAMADNDVSVQEVEELTAAPAFPNPAVDMISIPLNNTNVSGDVQIFDVEGRLISSQPVQFNGNTLVVSVTDLSNGIYTFRLGNENGSVQSFNIVVSR